MEVDRKVVTCWQGSWEQRRSGKSDRRNCNKDGIPSSHPDTTTLTIAGDVVGGSASGNQDLEISAPSM